ncbi:MAG: peptidylprolyl isomerase [Nitrosotalea sp.]
MFQDAKLFSVRKFDFHLRHLLVIGILIISFSISALVRSQAADYGFQLNEFDPFFNYRATQYLLDNGLNAYVHWHDTMSWYPTGRDVFATAQVPLHVTDAALYKIFGGGMSLYDFTIIFPVVFGSMTAIVIFALVRVLGGTSAGLFASLFFALSPPIIVRGTIGWFKSEPLGLFYGLLGVYLFLSGLKSENKKVAISKLVGGGFFLAVGFASWGGIEFFLLPLGLFFVALPFIRKDHKFLLWAVPLFVAVTMIIAGGLFARPGPTFVFGVRGLAMIGPAILLVVIIFVQKYSKEQHRIRNSLLVLAALLIIGGAVLASSSMHSVSFRYLNAVNPFLTSEDPLVDSVAEHATPTLAQNFSYFSILMLFAGLGIWLVFRKKNGDENASRFSIRNEMIVFALIIGIVGAYAGSTFSRLELLTATSVIILSSIGIAILTADILKRQNTPVKFVESSKKGTGSKKEIPTKKTNELLGRIPKIAFVAVVLALLLVPALYPVNANWISITKSPPTILNGGSNFAISTDDWPNALNWIKNNTPKDSVVASWWDYGYWVQTLGERKTLADNATIDTSVIANIARMLMASPDEAWKMLNKAGANYVLVYVVGQKFVSNGQDLYILGGGGDESKKQWFMKIGGLDSTKFLQDDSFTPTDYFWTNTLLGKMFPFTPLTYYDPNTHNESPTYTTGYTAIYSKTIKYAANSTGPLRLVYSSPSLDRKDSGVFSGVLIYQVNPDYKSQTGTTASYNASQGNSSSTTTIKPTTTTTAPSGGNIAVINTKFGDIKFRLFDSVAPKTTANFIKLANSGFYDKTVFHRIMPGFVIQGGDPNTKTGDRSTWGLGDAGYTIPPEFSSTLNFTKYMVGMARGNDVNSGSSQFFITTGDAPWLNNQYTLFGEVVSGQDVVDKIASLQTNPTTNQPNDADAARVTTITIEPSSNSTSK